MFEHLQRHGIKHVSVCFRWQKCSAHLFSRDLHRFLDGAVSQNYQHRQQNPMVVVSPSTSRTQNGLVYFLDDSVVQLHATR